MSNSNSYLQRGAFRTSRRGTTRGPSPPVEEIWVQLVMLLVTALLEQPLLRLLLGVVELVELPRR